MYERYLPYVVPMMRFMQFFLNKSSLGIRSLKERLEGVREPSLDGRDHEKVASLNPMSVFSEDSGTSDGALKLNESKSSVFFKKSSMRSNDTFPIAVKSLDSVISAICKRKKTLSGGCDLVRYLPELRPKYIEYCDA